MLKLPQLINFLAITVISLSLTALAPASAAQEPGSIEKVKQSRFFQELAQNANAADYLRQGITRLEQNDLAGAEAALRKAIELDPNDAKAYTNLGVALARQGKLEEAIAEYKQATHFDPNSAATHTNLGSALARQGNLEEAVAEHKQAIRISPTSTAAHTNLGSALARQGKLEEAIAAYRQALRINSSFAEAHYNLGLALSTQGELDEAVIAYQTAKDLFQAQGKTQEVSKVEQLIQRASRQKDSVLIGLTPLMLSITGWVMWCRVSNYISRVSD